MVGRRRKGVSVDPKNTKRRKGQRRDSVVRVEQRAEVAKLYNLGWLQIDIAEELGVTRQQISYDLQVLRKQWLESSLIDTNEAKLRQLARLDKTEEIAWELLYRSMEPKETITDAESALGPSLSTVKREQRDCNPAFLAQILSCISKRCDILGLIPKAGEAPGAGGDAGRVQPSFENMSLEEKKMFRNILGMPKEVGARAMAKFLGLPEPVEEPIKPPPKGETE